MKNKGKSPKSSAKAEKKAGNPRRAVFSLTPAAFLAFFSGEHRYRIIENPIPPNATIVDVRFNAWESRQGTIEVLIEHESIPELVEGEPIPYVKSPMAEAITEPVKEFPLE